jgi:hypothetical protein
MLISFNQFQLTLLGDAVSQQNIENEIALHDLCAKMVTAITEAGSMHFT